MLNELLIAERGARQAQIDMYLRHPDVKDAGGKSTLLVQLDEKGHVARLQTMPPEVTPWTLRDGQQNSFPFVQPRYPLWGLPDGDEVRKAIIEKKKEERWRAILEQKKGAQFNGDEFKNWPGKSMIGRLRERQEQLAVLSGTNAGVVPSTIAHFLLACDPEVGGSPQRLLGEVVNRLVEDLERTAQDAWVEIAVALLVGKKKKGKWVCDGALLFETAGYAVSIADKRLITDISDVLLRHSQIEDASVSKTGICGLEGVQTRLFTGNFPQPNLPAGLGQSYLFSKNKEIPANDRYGQFSAEAMPVGQGIIVRLDGALRALTCKDRKNKTWRAIPGEAPKQSDLLLAFVDKALDAPAIALLVRNDDEEDLSEEEPNSVAGAVSSVAAFEKRTERLIEAVRARIKADFRNTPVRLMVIRKVDPANRKVVFSGTPTVAEVYNAATTWVAGERNVPSWLTLPVLKKGERRPHPIPPPHVAPLELIAFSKKVYIRGGTESQEVVGLTAAETLRCFFEPAGNGGLSSRHRMKRILRLVLNRRAMLVIGMAHAFRRGFDFEKNYDPYDTLQTITLLGVLLYKLDRKKEVYMNEMAFKLGQLLAAADIVHAGYCADVRGGDVPPALLGNQVFAMAQTSPNKALATLCRRWKPYDGWAKKAGRESNRAEALIASKEKEERRRGWDIKKALRYAREMGPLAEELATALVGCRVDDIYLAELLLGYIAGLPKAQREDVDVQDTNQNGKQEG